jgi:hypothetical protein
MGGPKLRKNHLLSGFPAAAPLSVSLSTVASCHNHQSHRQLPQSSQSLIQHLHREKRKKKQKQRQTGGEISGKKKKTEREKQGSERAERRRKTREKEDEGEEPPLLRHHRQNRHR